MNLIVMALLLPAADYSPFGGAADYSPFGGAARATRCGCGPECACEGQQGGTCDCAAKKAAKGDQPYHLYWWHGERGRPRGWYVEEGFGFEDQVYYDRAEAQRECDRRNGRSRRAVKSCPCSAACECGCNEGQPCRCGGTRATNNAVGVTAVPAMERWPTPSPASAAPARARCDNSRRDPAFRAGAARHAPPRPVAMPPARPPLRRAGC